jgi:hypothetical protein
MSLMDIEFESSGRRNEKKKKEDKKQPQQEQKEGTPRCERASRRRKMRAVKFGSRTLK